MTLAIVHLLTHPLTEEFSSLRYLKAGSEIFAFLIIGSWTLTYFYNPGQLEDNSISRRIGYNNLCVGFDEPPAKYFAFFLWPLSTYFNIRFAWLEVVTEHSLDESQTSATGKCMTTVASGLFVVSVLFQTFILVFPPGEGAAVYIHSAFFIQYIVIRLLVVATQFYKNQFDGNTEDQDSITSGQWTWFYLFTLASILVPVFAVSDYIYYDFYKPADVEGTLVPWYICLSADLAWFACLATTAKFLPAHHDYKVQQVSKAAHQEGVKQ